MARKGNNGQQKHPNRRAQQKKTKDSGGKVKRKQKQSRADSGTEQIVTERAINNEDFRLDWFKPTERQKDIIYSMYEDDLTVVQGSSGTGKSTTVIWQALKDLKSGRYKGIVFVKSPSQVGDDDLGALKGDLSDKLLMHWASMKSIFHTFMSKQKLEAEERAGRIRFTVPNFITGETLDNVLVIMDESQFLSPKTTKLLLERAGKGTKVVLMGDRSQDYSTKYRADGFTDFVKKVTKVDEEGRYSDVETIGYVEMTAADNMRSDLSKLIVALYEES